MKKIIKLVVLMTFAIFSLTFCSACQDGNSQKMNLIPEQNIKYSHIEIGNVIQDGKQAVFLNFKSDYTVEKIEYAGVLLDKEGNTICTFDKELNFGNPSCNVSATILIDYKLIKNVKSVSFTKVNAYTTEKIS